MAADWCPTLTHSGREICDKTWQEKALREEKILWVAEVPAMDLAQRNNIDISSGKEKNIHGTLFVLDALVIAW